MHACDNAYVARIPVCRLHDSVIMHAASHCKRARDACMRRRLDIYMLGSALTYTDATALWFPFGQRKASQELKSNVVKTAVKTAETEYASVGVRNYWAQTHDGSRFSKSVSS